MEWVEYPDRARAHPDVRRRAEELRRKYGVEPTIAGEPARTLHELELWDQYHGQGQAERMSRLADARFDGGDDARDAEERTQEGHPFRVYERRMWEQRNPELVADMVSREAQRREEERRNFERGQRLDREHAVRVEQANRRAEEALSGGGPGDRPPNFYERLEAGEEPYGGQVPENGLEESPAGTGDRGTSWYYSREADDCIGRADLAGDAAEREHLREWADYYSGLADVREDLEAGAAEEHGLTPNEAAEHDLKDAMSRPEGERQHVADELGLDYTEEELAGLLGESQDLDSDDAPDPSRDDQGDDRDDEEGLGY